MSRLWAKLCLGWHAQNTEAGSEVAIFFMILVWSLLFCVFFARMVYESMYLVFSTGGPGDWDYTHGVDLSDELIRALRLIFCLAALFTSLVALWFAWVMLDVVLVWAM